MTKGQTVICKTLHRKLQIDQYEPHKEPTRPSSYINRIDGVMAIMLVSSAGERGFEPRLGQTKDYKICICCFSAK